MSDQFVVPQFIDNEDTIIGPVTARQFLIMMVTCLFAALWYRLLRFGWFLAVGIPWVILGAVLAFVRINGQPFHFFILNILQTFRRPGLRVWDKSLTDAEVRVYSRMEAPEPVMAEAPKARLSGSRLQELTMVVNTGGAYRPEESE